MTWVMESLNYEHHSQLATGINLQFMSMVRSSFMAEYWTVWSVEFVIKLNFKLSKICSWVSLRILKNKKRISVFFFFFLFFVSIKKTLNRILIKVKWNFWHEDGFMTWKILEIVSTLSILGIFFWKWVLLVRNSFGKFFHWFSWLTFFLQKLFSPSSSLWWTSAL